MDKYAKKQFKIALVYLLIAIIVVGGIYLIVKSTLPSCSDGIQNQDELGVDCGGPCEKCPEQLQKDLEVIFTEPIATKDNYVDVVAKVRNPNRDFGAKEFTYVFNLFDSNDNLVASRNGSSYMMPQETRYIIEQRILASSSVSRSELKINTTNWQQLVGYPEPELLIRNSNLKQSDNESQFTATLDNRSSYGFKDIDVWVVLLGKNSKILGAGKSELNTVLSRENRYFEISWFFPLADKVENFDIVATTNVFLDDNFMKAYNEEREKFQEY